MTRAPEATDEEKRPGADTPQWTAAVLVLAAIVLTSVAVASRAGQAAERERGPLELAAPSELRSVFLGLSAVMRADAVMEGAALSALKAQRAQSYGALDHRDSCLKTDCASGLSETLDRRAPEKHKA